MVDDPRDPRNRAASITALYNNTRDQKQQQEQAKQPEKTQGSQMVRESAPGMHLRPKGPERQAVDGQIHNEKLAAERQAKLREILQKAQEKAQADKSRERERGDRER